MVIRLYPCVTSTAPPSKWKIEPNEACIQWLKLISLVWISGGVFLAVGLEVTWSNTWDLANSKSMAWSFSEQVPKKSRIEGAVVGLQRTKSQSQKEMKEWDTFPQIIHPTNLQRCTQTNLPYMGFWWFLRTKSSWIEALGLDERNLAGNSSCQPRIFPAKPTHSISYVVVRPILSGEISMLVGRKPNVRWCLSQHSPRWAKMTSDPIYPPVNCYITMENHHFSWENPLFLWPFSIANC